MHILMMKERTKTLLLHLARNGVISKDTSEVLSETMTGCRIADSYHSGISDIRDVEDVRKAIVSLLKKLVNFRKIEAEKADDWVQWITGCRFGESQCDHDDCMEKVNRPSWS